MALLQQRAQTADDLAVALGVTTNAVREHLAGMQREGLVQRTGKRRGATRPSQLFELTPEVEQSLSQAYIPFLMHLVQVFAGSLSTQEVDAMMRQVGKAIAAGIAPRTRPRSLRGRVSLASRLLNQQLGAVTRVEENGLYIIRGAGCPLAALTGKHPSVCLAVESLVTEVVGSPAQECCNRGGRPRCCFEIRR